MICEFCRRQQHGMCGGCTCQHKVRDEAPEPKYPEPEEAA